MEGVTDQEKVLLGRYAKYLELGSGYFEIQRTKPQTLGYSLNDSPVGLAGWIIEKFHSWTDDEKDKLIVSLEDVLSIVSLYWFSESITSSMRLYNENGREGFSKSKVEVPTGQWVLQLLILKTLPSHSRYKVSLRKLLILKTNIKKL